MAEIKVGDCFKETQAYEGTYYYRVDEVLKGQEFSTSIFLSIYEDEPPQIETDRTPSGVKIPRSEFDAAAEKAIAKIQEVLKVGE